MNKTQKIGCALIGLGIMLVGLALLVTCALALI